MLCIPLDRRLPKLRLRSRQLHRLLGARLVLRVDGWDRGSNYPHAHLLRVLGPVNDLTCVRPGVGVGAAGGAAWVGGWGFVAVVLVLAVVVPCCAVWAFEYHEKAAGGGAGLVECLGAFKPLNADAVQSRRGRQHLGPPHLSWVLRHPLVLPILQTH